MNKVVHYTLSKCYYSLPYKLLIVSFLLFGVHSVRTNNYIIHYPFNCVNCNGRMAEKRGYNCSSVMLLAHTVDKNGFQPTAINIKPIQVFSVCIYGNVNFLCLFLITESFFIVKNSDDYLQIYGALKISIFFPFLWSRMKISKSLLKTTRNMHCII